MILLKEFIIYYMNILNLIEYQNKLKCNLIYLFKEEIIKIK